MYEVVISGYKPDLHTYDDAFLRLRIFYRNTESKEELFSFLKRRMQGSTIIIPVEMIKEYYAGRDPQADDSMRQCVYCMLLLPISKFRIQQSKYVAHTCKTCMNKQSKGIKLQRVLSMPRTAPGRGAAVRNNEPTGFIYTQETVYRELKVMIRNFFPFDGIRVCLREAVMEKAS